MTAWTYVELATAAWAVGMAVMVILERRSPTATLAWILVLAVLPVVGWVIYRLIGPRRLARRRLRRQHGRRIVEEQVGVLHELDDAAPGHQRGQLARLAMAAGEAGPLRADAVALYTEGDEAYAAIEAAIAAARHHVHLEYYIWEPDVVGTRLRDLLARRAREGVEIRLILDGTGAAQLKAGFLAPLRAAGAQVAWFNPVRLRSLRRRRADFRSHRKIVVVDGVVGFTGGMNVAACHSRAARGDAAWRDTHLRLEGSAVRALQRVFAEDWYFTAEARLPGEAYYPAPAGRGDEIVQIVASGPDGDAFAIHKVLFAAIGQATERVWLTTPYFVPDAEIATALVTAALRGVDVRVIIPARGDSRLVDLAARSYVPELVAAGVRVHEYLPRFVHAKTSVIDDDLAVVGTANLDNRSFRLNFEVAALCFGGAINARLAQAFRDDLDACRELTGAALRRAPFWTRLGEASARLLSPLL